MISAVVAPNHVFLQQVTHPTYPSLARLDHCMAQCYNEFVTPGLPRPIRPSMICAAPSMGGWYRAKVVAVYPPSSYIVQEEEEIVEKSDVPQEVEGVENPTAASVDPELLEIPDIEDDFEVDICFVDYGGYSRVLVSSLRQIRADFMTLPFQAIECLLANVAPMSGNNHKLHFVMLSTNYVFFSPYFSEEGWSAEAYEELENMTRDRMLQAQAMAYSLEGLPLVYIYQMDTTDEPIINRQLVNRGVAQWVEPQLVSN